MDASASFSQLQAVSVGRLKLAKALLVVDEEVSIVLSRNSQLLSAILLNGPSRIIPLSSAARICGEGTKEGEEKCVMLVGSAEGDHVVEARELLQGVFQGDVPVYATQSVSGTGCVPWFVCKLPLPQPTMLIMGSGVRSISFHAEAQERTEELKTLAFQASTLLESISGGAYELFAIGARPRALAGAIKQQQQQAKAITSSESWGGGDDATHVNTNVVILDRESDLISPTSFPSTFLSRLAWLLGPGTAADPSFPSLACKDVHVGAGLADGSMYIEGGGGRALLEEVGGKSWDAGLKVLAEKLAYDGELQCADGTCVEGLGAVRERIVKSGEGVKKRGLVEWCSAVEKGLGVPGGGDAAMRHASALKVVQLAAEDALSDEVALQLGELADSSARKGGGLKLCHILEMAVHTFARLGQKGVAEELAKGDESEGMMRLQAALASLVMRLESASGGGRGRKVGAEVEELIQRLVKVARRHGKGCGELAEGEIGESSPENFQPLTRTVVHSLIEKKGDFSVYHHGGGQGGSVTKAFQMGSSLFRGKGAGGMLQGGCELLVVLFVGGVTVEEVEIVKRVADGGAVKGVLVLATGVASNVGVVRDLCTGLPIISSHL